jgi:3'(2'), 5'-bisphosphate nucleotidase
MNNIHFLLETAQQAATEAGKAILEIYNAGDFSVALKKDESPLTKADKSSHRIITEILSKTNLPVLSEEGAGIDFNERKSWDYFWVADPLDGTKEFISKNGEFTINIALVKQNKPVAGLIYVPCTGVMYFSSEETGIFKNNRGVQTRIHPLAERRKFNELLQKEHLIIVASRSHLTPETKAFIDQFKNCTMISLGSSLKFMLLLENQADIYPRLGTTMEWDTAAAHAILNASNRGVYQMDLKSELIYNKKDLSNPSFIAF